jgi:hypothetical protein
MDEKNHIIFIYNVKVSTTEQIILLSGCDFFVPNFSLLPLSVPIMRLNNEIKRSNEKNVRRDEVKKK